MVNKKKAPYEWNNDVIYPKFQNLKKQSAPCSGISGRLTDSEFETQS